MRDVVKTNVKRKQSTRRSRRRQRQHSAYLILVLVLVVGIGITLSMTLMFNVQDIIVVNETDTPDTTIVEYSGIEAGDNLVRIDTAIAAERIHANVVYAEKVTVDRIYPSTVKIKVERAKPIANISQSYGYLLVSTSNRVLEELKGSPCEGLIVVYGYNPAQGTIGMYLKSEDEKRDNVLKTITAAVDECADERIQCIDMTDQSDILVRFGDNVIFHMGSAGDAVYKLKLAAKTIECINPRKQYRLVMVGNNQISVLPEKEEAFLRFTREGIRSESDREEESIETTVSTIDTSYIAVRTTYTTTVPMEGTTTSTYMP
ncbi:MAG: FtsQ-type POTRA domain-containing protein [Oscillospiraceae bacterium]|nr:FtsQ-type POTRA domain-containing protein [Oscillospiraceae bacterium]